MSLDPKDFQKILESRLRKGHDFKVTAFFKKKEYEILNYSQAPTFPNETRGTIFWKNKSPMENLVRDCAERLGLIEMTTEVYPSSENLKKYTAQIGIKFDNHHAKEWPSWFSQVTQDFTFSPDTNIILSRTLSAVIGNRIPGLLINRIRIPRLVVLELENLANDPKRVSKGVCFMAYNEIRELKANYHAIIGFTLPSDELIAFLSPKRGYFADSYIRQEVRRMSELLPKRDILFIARDMVNALTANAEGMDAIYISPRYPDQTKLEKMLYDDITELLIEIATAKHEIIIQWNEGKPFKEKIEGVWHGKRWFDYYKRRIRRFSLDKIK